MRIWLPVSTWGSGAWLPTVFGSAAWLGVGFCCGSGRLVWRRVLLRVRPFGLASGSAVVFVSVFGVWLRLNFDSDP